MLIAAFIIASFFPPYDQLVLSNQAVPGIVAGQCVAAGAGPISYLVAVVCGGGGGGGASLTADQTFTNSNTFTNPNAIIMGAPGAGVYSAPIKVFTGAKATSFFTLGSSGTDTCAGIVGTAFDLFTDPTHNGPIMTSNASGNIGFCGITTANTLFVGAPGNDSSFGLRDAGLGNWNFNTITPGGLTGCVDVDSALSFNSGSSGEIEFSGTAGNVCITGALLQASHTLTLGTATISLGNTGAPSDPCVNGSIYTRSDGTVGASHYDCYGAVWHASAT